MNHAAFVGFIPKKAPVVVLAFLVQLASDDNAIVINAVLGDDLYAGSVGLSEDVFNGAHVAHRYVRSL